MRALHARRFLSKGGKNLMGVWVMGSSKIWQRYHKALWGHNLVGIDEAKPGCGHILGFSEVRELFTLPDVDGNLTPLGSMLLILRTIFDSKLL